MSIIIKKKPKYNKKRILQRVIILICIYFLSFFILYAFFGEKKVKVQADNPPEQITYTNDGELFFAEEKYPEAIEFFLRLINDYPEDFLAMNKLAQAYQKLNQIDKAKFYYFKSKELAPKFSENYIGLTDLYIEQRDFLAAENMIDIMPTEKKQDFVAKGNLLLKLANAETEMEDKIILYGRAASYFRKYDTEVYENTIKLLLQKYFELAKYYVDTGDNQNAVNVYKNITKYKDNCEIQNKLALCYMNISDDAIIYHLKKAVSSAKTQQEKRLTKQNIIDLKYYFEKKSDFEKSALMNEFLILIDESSILVDETFSSFAIKNDSVEFVDKNKKMIPVIKFQVANQTQEDASYLDCKIVVYNGAGKIFDKKEFPITIKNTPLKANSETTMYKIKMDKSIKKSKIPNYIITLSLSDDSKLWQLHRVYKKDD